jgi:hypothetical protein
VLVVASGLKQRPSERARLLTHQEAASQG